MSASNMSTGTQSLLPTRKFIRIKLTLRCLKIIWFVSLPDQGRSLKLVAVYCTFFFLHLEWKHLFQYQIEIVRVEQNQYRTNSCIWLFYFIEFTEPEKFLVEIANGPTYFLSYGEKICSIEISALFDQWWLSTHQKMSVRASVSKVFDICIYNGNGHTFKRNWQCQSKISVCLCTHKKKHMKSRICIIFSCVFQSK